MLNDHCALYGNAPFTGRHRQLRRRLRRPLCKKASACAFCSIHAAVRLSERFQSGGRAVGRRGGAQCSRRARRVAGPALTCERCARSIVSIAAVDGRWCCCASGSGAERRTTGACSSRPLPWMPSSSETSSNAPSSHGAGATKPYSAHPSPGRQSLSHGKNAQTKSIALRITGATARRITLCRDVQQISMLQFNYYN